jgi:hypothetical protein
MTTKNKNKAAGGRQQADDGINDGMDDGARGAVGFADPITASAIRI